MHVEEDWAIHRLQRIIDLTRLNRNALPGSVVKLVEQAQDILKRRRDHGKPVL
jgi:hypothetical protein